MRSETVDCPYRSASSCSRLPTPLARRPTALVGLLHWIYSFVIFFPIGYSLCKLGGWFGRPTVIGSVGGGISNLRRGYIHLTRPPSESCPRRFAVGVSEQGVGGPWPPNITWRSILLTFSVKAWPLLSLSLGKSFRIRCTGPRVERVGS